MPARRKQVVICLFCPFQQELIYFRDGWVGSTKLSLPAQYRWYQVIYQLGVMISRSSVNVLTIRSRFLPILTALQVLTLSLVSLGNRNSGKGRKTRGGGRRANGAAAVFLPLPLLRFPRDRERVNPFPFSLLMYVHTTYAEDQLFIKVYIRTYRTFILQKILRTLSVCKCDRLLLRSLLPLHSEHLDSFRVDSFRRTPRRRGLR